MRSWLPAIFFSLSAVVFYSCGGKAVIADESYRRMMMVPDSSYFICADINDIDDPARYVGVDFAIGNNKGDVRIGASSSNTDVVPNANLFISGEGSIRNLRIVPIAAGYTTISVTVTNGSGHQHYILNYAASYASMLNGKRWHTGAADASAAIIVDKDYMIVANDETNYLYLYSREHSGLPVSSFDFNQNNVLQLTDSSMGHWKEVDVEAGVKSLNDPSVIYWIGSMSNNGAFFNKPNRDRLFAITVSGKGANSQFRNAGHYSGLRQDLILWGNGYGYQFDSSAAAGKDAKRTDGFNIEGMVFGPDNKTLFIAFRAPLVPVINRTKAIIAPVMNFERWFNKGQPSGSPQIGKPVELDLDGRGIRDIIRLPNGNYVIIAGSSSWEIVPAVYSWSGLRNNPPVKLSSFDLAGLNVEGVLPVYDGNELSLNKLQVLTDNGNDIFYGDTICAKNLSCDSLKKFSSVITECTKWHSSPLKIEPNLVPYNKP